MKKKQTKLKITFDNIAIPFGDFFFAFITISTRIWLDLRLTVLNLDSWIKIIIAIQYLSLILSFTIHKSLNKMALAKVNDENVSSVYIVQHIHIFWSFGTWGHDIGRNSKSKMEKKVVNFSITSGCILRISINLMDPWIIIYWKD